MRYSKFPLVGTSAYLYVTAKYLFVLRSNCNYLIIIYINLAAFYVGVLSGVYMVVFWGL